MKTDKSKGIEKVQNNHLLLAGTQTVVELLSVAMIDANDYLMSVCNLISINNIELLILDHLHSLNKNFT